MHTKPDLATVISVPMYLTYFPESLGAKPSPFPWAKAFCLALLLALGTAAHAQTSASMLFPRPELLKPRIQPGTLAQDPPESSSLHIEILQGDRAPTLLRKKPPSPQSSRCATAITCR